MTWSLLEWILISKEGNVQTRTTTVPNTLLLKKSPKVLGDEILNLQIVFIRTASCLRGQQSSLVVDHGRPGKKRRRRNMHVAGSFGSKMRWLSLIVKDLNRTWNRCCLFTFYRRLSLSKTRPFSVVSCLRMNMQRFRREPKGMSFWFIRPM
jgi:hypothetical protein